jgi:hypothetical protein
MDITVVHGEDWCGLYINGTLEYEGHSLPWFEVIHALQRIAPDFFLNIIETPGDVSSEYLETQGHLPQVLTAIPWE